MTTHGPLATKRLTRLCASNPLFVSNKCSLADIHTISAPTAEFALFTLRESLPKLMQDVLKKDCCKPIKLLIIDSFGLLFHGDGQPSEQSALQRSGLFYHISGILHALASQHDIAVVLLNTVVDVFSEEDIPDRPVQPVHVPDGEIAYRPQQRWFSRSMSNEVKEVGFGLAWANQPNVRVVMTRTRLSLPSSTDENIGVPVRRMAVVFSPFGLQGSIDYTITEGGISSPKPFQDNAQHPNDLPPPSTDFEVDEVPPSDDDLEYSYRVMQRTGTLHRDQDGFADGYWDDFDNIPDEVFQDIQMSHVN